MNEELPRPEPSASRGHTPTAQLVVLIGIVGGMLGIVGVLFEMGSWKGKMEQKVETQGEQLAKHEERLNAVEPKADQALRNTEIILKGLGDFREDMNRRLDAEHAENKSRFDRQMERLDKISDGRPAAH